MALTFEWDEEKARKNYQKHQVSFNEAKTVFNDPFLITIKHIVKEKKFNQYVCGYFSRENRNTTRIGINDSW